MGNFKINLDRKKLTKDYIDSKQNFESIITTLKTSKSTLLKNGWFYGSIGLAGVATIIGVSSLLQDNVTQNKVASASQEKTQTIAYNTDSNRTVETISYQEKSQKNTENSFNTTESPSKNSSSKSKLTSPSSLPVSATKTAANQEVSQPISVIPTTPTINKPTIAGVFNGDIPWEKFNQGEITLSDGFVVKQFSLYYASRVGDKTVTIEGAKVPQNILKEIESIGLNQTVFITNIIGEDSNKELIRCLSMEMNLKFK